MLNLTIIIGSLDSGGCERHLLQILPKISRSKINITVFQISKEGKLAEKFRELGINVIKPILSLEKKRNKLHRLIRLTATILQFAWFCLSVKTDIFHFFLPGSYHLCAPITLLLTRSRLIMSRRSLNNYMKGKPFINWLEKKLHKRIDYILGNSRAVCKELIEDENAPIEKVGLIYNGLDTQWFNQQKKQLDFSQQSLCEEFTLTCVANLIPYKGHKDLICALSSIAHDLPQNWRLLLAGRDDNLQDDLVQLSRDLGISHKVYFLGSVDNIPSLLSRSDIFILPSHEEGFSNALLEAMYAECPIVVTDVGGNKEALADGLAGLIVPARSPELLASAIKTLALDRNKAKALSQQARARVEEKFSVERCVSAYQELYTSKTLPTTLKVM
ncbi:glycosyltransferase [Thalassospira lucentensis]|uniref:glycosyltransferase n=1 Tax=Thalassospira lucentensis TaxID=168935 RepID=UPI003D265D19